MDKNRHVEVSSLGGKNKRENYNKKCKQEEDGVSSSPSTLEDILNLLEEERGDEL